MELLLSLSVVGLILTCKIYNVNSPKKKLQSTKLILTAEKKTEASYSISRFEKSIFSGALKHNEYTVMGYNRKTNQQGS